MQLVSEIKTSLSQSKSEGHVSYNHPLCIVPTSRLIVSLTLPDQ